MAVVGSAEIIVRAITKQVRKDIKRAFEEARPEAAKAGRQAGKDFSGAFNQTLDQRLRPALSAAMSDAASSAASDAGRAAGKSLTDSVVPDAARAGRDAGRQLSDGIGAGSRSSSRNIGLIPSALKNIRPSAIAASNALTQMVGIGTLAGGAISGLVGMLSSAVSGLFALTSAALQAAGALAVLPGIISVVGQAFGALKLAFGGVGEAFKAGVKAQDAAAASASSGSKAAAAGAKSNEALKRAQEALTRAQKAAKRAQDALNKAQDRAADGAEEQLLAQTLLNAAEQKRKEILSDPNASASDGAAAQHAVDEAQQANERIEAERAKARKRLRAAEERDAQARARLAAAEAARDKARNAGGAGAAGAMSPAVKAANAYNDALSKLTPQAQEFVKKILDMREAFQGIGKLAQEAFFEPVNDGLDALLRSQFFEKMEKSLPKSAGILGQIGKQILVTFSNDANIRRFGQVLEGNNEILEVFKTKTEDGTTPVESLVNLITKLAVAIQPLTNRFAVWIGQLVTGADKSEAFSKSSLVKFFENAGDKAAQLGRIVGNIVGAFGNLGDASEESGNRLLDSFEGATQKFEEWSNKIKNDPATKKYFDDVATNLEKIGGLINTVSYEFGALGDNKGIGDLAKNLEPAIENIGKMFDNFNDNGGSLGKVAENVTAIMLAFTESEGIGLFLDTLNLIMAPIKWFLESSFGKWILGIAGMFFAVSKAVSFAMGIFKFFFKALLGGFFKIGDRIDGFKKKIASIKDVGLKKTLFGGKSDEGSEGNDAVDAAAPDTEEARQKGKTAGEAIMEGLIDGMAGGEAGVIDAVDSVVDKIKLQLEAARELSEDYGKYIAEGLAQGIRANLNDVAMASSDLGEEALEALKTKLGIASPSKVFAQQGEWTGEGFVNGVREEIGNAYKAGADLADAAADGARSQKIEANVAGTASKSSSGAGAAAAAAIDLPDIDGVSKNLDVVDKKMAGTTKKSGMLKGGFKLLGGGIKALAGGLLGLVGGPIGAIMLLITGLTLLYKKSPEFKKFVDNIVKAVVPVVKAIGGWFLGVLDKLFGWINKNMPTIKRVMGEVLDKVKTAFVATFEAIKSVWNNVLKPVFNVIKKVVTFVFKGVIAYVKILFKVYSTVFKAMKAVWDNVLKPVFNAVKNVAKNVFGAVVTAIDKMKNAFSKAKDLMSKAKDGIVNAFNKVKDGAKTPIKWVIDTVWNNGIVKMAGKIPGVDSGGWKVDTSGWATGGWTGPGRKYDVAGLVHADEFVIKKSSRRVIERMYPGLLDFMNRTGSVPSTAGYADGGAVKSLKGAGKGILNLGGSAIKWSGNVVKGGYNWTKGKVKEAYATVKEIIDWISSLPGNIASNLSTGFGKDLQGIPKGAANKFVSFVNGKVPDIVPGIPLKSVFPGIEFRAKGGRVRSGAPYVVGENQPELFVPDRAGTIIPSLKDSSAQATMKAIMSALQQMDGSINLDGTSNTNVNSGSKTLNVTVNNPAPERSSQSVTRTIRNRAVSAGWSV